MRLALGALAALAVVTIGAAGAHAGPDEDKLVIDGVEIATEAPAPEGHPLDRLYSGWRFRTDETQALQMDDFENPAMVAVEYGIELWGRPAGASGKSCADCHGDVSELAGLRAVMPKWSEAAGRPLTMEQWINWSIETHQEAEPWKWESQEMLGMTALIGLQSRGMPVAPDMSGGMAEWQERGKDLYYTRMGQLDFACATCHEANTGYMLRADHLSQGQSNGFPTYRLKWQNIGSLHRRLEGCVKDARAEPWKPGSDEFVALEAYLATRGAGLMIETPSVRQ